MGHGGEMMRKAKLVFSAGLRLASYSNMSVVDVHCIEQTRA